MCPSKRPLINRCASVSHSSLTKLLTWQTGAFADLKTKEVPHTFTTETRRQACVTTAFTLMLVAVTDGALALVGTPDLWQSVITVLSISTRLSVKLWRLFPVTTLVIRAVNCIRATGLQYYLLKLVDEVEAVDLILYADMFLPSPGKALQRFMERLPEIASSWIHEELSDILWLLDLEFLTGLTGKLTEPRRAKAAMWRTRLVLSAHLRSNSDFSAKTLTHFPISPER